MENMEYKVRYMDKICIGGKMIEVKERCKTERKLDPEEEKRIRTEERKRMNFRKRLVKEGFSRTIEIRL